MMKAMNVNRKGDGKMETRSIQIDLQAQQKKKTINEPTTTLASV